MTLCKYRPQRTYDAQYILEENDVRGLLKKLAEAVDHMGEEGLASTPYYVGAHDAFETLFECAKRDGEVDMWKDFMESFGKKLDDTRGGDQWDNAF